MNHKVTSRFSILSPERLSTEEVATLFPWLITERAADSRVKGNITVFDLGTGSHARADDHLAAARDALLAQEKNLRDLSDECRYTLWIRYSFPDLEEGSINLPVSLQRAFADLGVELIFHLTSESDNPPSNLSPP